MKITRFKFGNIDPDLKKSSVVFYIGYIIANLTCFSISIISPSPFPLGIQVMDIIIASFSFLSFCLFLLKKISLQQAVFFFSYILAFDLIVSDQYAIFNNMPMWEYIIFRDAFAFSISLIATGFICGPGTIIIQGIAYELMLVAAIVFPGGEGFSIDIFLFLMLLVVGFSFAVVIYKQSLTKALKQKLLLQQEVSKRDKEILEKEVELTKSKSEHLREIVQYKNRELTSHALLIVRHNERDKLLQKKLHGLSGLKDGELQKKINEIDAGLSEEREPMSWEIFKKRFEEVHPDFYKNLESKYPFLSPAERKLATLIRLGLASKEIASLTYNTKASVDVARSRLRKRLHLKRSVNIESFLTSL